MSTNITKPFVTRMKTHWTSTGTHMTGSAIAASMSRQSLRIIALCQN